MAKSGHFTTGAKTWDYEATVLRASANNYDTATHTVDATVYQDTDGDGTAENQETVTLSGGAEELTLASFSSVSGASYWVRVDATWDPEVGPTPEVYEFTVRRDKDSGTLVTDTVSWTFRPEWVDTDSTVNTDVAGIEVQVFQDSDQSGTADLDKLAYPTGGYEEHDLGTHFDGGESDVWLEVEMATILDQNGNPVAEPRLDLAEIPAPGGVVAGFITDKDGAGVGDADVMVVNQSTDAVTRTTPASDGYYEFSGLPNGTYHMATRAEDADGKYNAVSYPFINVPRPRDPHPSAILRWKMYQGSGTTLMDSVEDYDGTLDGSWASDADAVDGYMTSYNGTDDHASHEIRLNEDYVAGAITVQPSSWDTASFNYVVDGGSDSNGNRSHMLRQNNGSLEFLARSGGAWCKAGTGSLPATGSKTRLGYRFDGSTVDLFVNGSVAASTSCSGTLDYWVFNEIARRKYQDGGTGDLVEDRHYAGELDDLVVCAASTASDLPGDQWFQDDYNAQPWS